MLLFPKENRHGQKTIFFPRNSFRFSEEQGSKQISEKGIARISSKYGLRIQVIVKNHMWINITPDGSTSLTVQQARKVGAEVVSFMLTTDAPSCEGFNFRKPLTKEEQEKKLEIFGKKKINIKYG